MTPDEFMKRYERATAAHDLESTLDLIAEDAVYLFSNRSAHFGKSAIRDALCANFAAIEAESYSIDGLEWLVVQEGIAVAIFEYRWSGVINGKPASGSGRGTTVIKATAEGWTVVHEHLSPGRLR